MRCLLIEDDIATSDLIREGLTGAGHEVIACHDGSSGLAHANNERWDLVVLDRMLPGGMDGLDILATMRLRDDHTPVLVLSALSSLDERIRGLRSGGDDYLTKPFALDEMLARVEALARRASQRPEPEVFSVGDLSLEPRTRRVFRNGRPVALQPREYQLLEYLVRHQGEVVTRKMLLAAVWGFHFDPETNVIDVQMSRLRTKLDEGGAAPLIRTVRGVGFTIGDNDDGTHVAE
ncbi:response regulator transcription factor [Dyella telluris]|uniref:Response regulator transcription factor n=1 Tax=Dyella telluris TaxID=2763498 RepID=A0A7G8Q543_9GAMM|nr:response regulator transcription factor [Dyella telluris]QNK01901.1 response regulator transcription factor [Dyella telluris]